MLQCSGVEKFFVFQKIFRLINIQVYTDMPWGHSTYLPHLPPLLFPSPLSTIFSHSSPLSLPPSLFLPYLFCFSPPPHTTLLSFSPPSSLFYPLLSIIAFSPIPLFLSPFSFPFDYLPESPSSSLPSAIFSNLSFIKQTLLQTTLYKLNMSLLFASCLNISPWAHSASVSVFGGWPQWYNHYTPLPFPVFSLPLPAPTLPLFFSPSSHFSLPLFCT